MNANEEEVTLELLTAIERDGETTQRDLARSTGVALGLVNSYIRRCVRKGWIKINEAPANRYVYFLTPVGFSEKIRLTTRYVSESFSFYRRASVLCERMLEKFAQNGIESVILLGASDLAEIVLLKSLESSIEVVGIVDRYGQRTQFYSKPVWKNLPAEIVPDALVLTDILHPSESFTAAAAEFDTTRIFVPEILGGWAGKELAAEHIVV